MAQHQAHQGQRRGHRRHVPTQCEGQCRHHCTASEDELREVHSERVDDRAPEGPAAAPEEPPQKDVAVEAMREGPRLRKSKPRRL